MRTSILLAAVTGLLVAPTALAAPATIAHHGVLTDSDDRPITGKVSMVFRFYDAKEGGFVAWRSDACEVQVQAGRYGVVLGEDCRGPTPLDTRVFPLGERRYLEVEIGGTALKPRLNLSPVPRALAADEASVAQSAKELDCVGCVDETQLGDAAVTPGKIAAGATERSVLSTLGGKAEWEQTGGVAPNRLLRLDADGRLPTVDASQLVNLPPELGGNPVSTSAPQPGQLLVWNGSAWTPYTPPFYGAGCEPGSMVTGIGQDGSLQCYVPKGFTKITTGKDFSCAIISDGTVRCWGAGANGRLGNNLATDKLTPVAVKTATGLLSNVIDISSGYEHTCAVVGVNAGDAQGEVWCWGVNGSGRLGDGSTTERRVAVQVQGITTAVQVTSGYQHTCARLQNNTAKCWGDNGNWRLGNNGSTVGSATPVDVYVSENVIGTDILDISAGGHSTCIVRAGGSAWCWGSNTSGALGSSTPGNKMRPERVTGLTQVTRIRTALSYQGGDTGWQPFTCAINAGDVWCWGRNANGQLGDGTTVGKTSPVRVQIDETDTGVQSGLLTSAVDIEVGGVHSCAVAGADRTLYCWGYNGSYQTANAPATNRTRAVPVRTADDSGVVKNVISVANSTNTAGSTMFVMQEPGSSTGTALGMGHNANGQLGDGTKTTTQGLPVYVTLP